MAKLTKNIWAIISIIAGVLVIISPAILAWIIGLYLIINGILDLKK